MTAVTTFMAVNPRSRARQKILETSDGRHLTKGTRVGKCAEGRCEHFLPGPTPEEVQEDRDEDAGEYVVHQGEAPRRVRPDII